MKLRSLASLILVVFLLTIQEASAAPSSSIERSPDGRERTLALIKSFAIDTDDTIHFNPAIAQCGSGDYLMVYEYEVDGLRMILGMMINASGWVNSPPRIIYPNGSEDYYDSYNPDVACDENLNRYVVTWQVDYQNQGTDYDIYARGITGDYSNWLFGDLIFVSTSTSMETNPSIACNSFEHNCMIVFESNLVDPDYDIYMQRLSVEYDSLTVLGDRYQIWNSGNVEHNPDVAFGMNSGSYLVTWQWMYTTPDPDHYRILYDHLYDTEQGNGVSESQHGPTYLIGVSEQANNQTEPVAAYSPLSNSYMVAYIFEYYTTDIMGMRVPGTGQVQLGNPFYISGSSVRDEFSPAIAYVGGASGVVNFGPNQFAVALLSYENNQMWLFVRSLYGSVVPGSDQRDSRYNMEIKYTGSISSSMQDVDISGSRIYNRYLLGYIHSITGVAGTDYDLYGAVIDPYSLYLPLLQK